MSDQKLSRQANTILSPYPSSPQAAGMIVAFAGSSAPSGWALCNGAEIAIASYDQLYARIGTTWNQCFNPQNGNQYSAPAGGNFRIPDLRGAFLRNIGTFAGTFAYDPANTLALGAYKVDQFQGHSHNLTISNTDSFGAFYPVLGPNSDILSVGVSAPIDDGTNGTTRFGKETSPKQVGINYLIKLYDDSGSIIMSGSPFIGSEFRPSPISIAGNNSLSLDKFYTINSGSPSTQTLPPATGSGGVITVENAGAGLVTVDGNAAETINGVANQILGQYASLKIRDYAAGQWIIMH